MLTFLQQLSFWDWLALGSVLLIFEVFGAGGYLLWMGLSASLVGVLLYFIPTFPWTWQFVLFALLSIVTAVLWWQRQKSKTSDQSGLNQRGSELIGRMFTVHESIIGGRGKIKAGDTLWLVQGADTPSGSSIRVVGQAGVVLLVEPL